MTATDILRRLLDERGVEHETHIEPTTGFEHVKWNFGEHGSADFNIEFGEPWLVMYGTISGPAQAIDATLGRGTCHAVFEVDAMSEDDRIGEFVCSECGETFGDGRDQLPHYCPACGRRVVE